MGKAIYQAILDNDYNLALVGLLVATLATIAGQPAGRPRLCLGRPARLARRMWRHDGGRSSGRPAWRRMLRHRLAWPRWRSCSVMLVLALAAPLIAELRGVDPTQTDLFRRFEGPSAAALAGHRRSRPRSLPAPARRRPRVAAGRHLGRAPVGDHRRRHRRPGGLSRRPARRLADARHRRRDLAAAAAAADRAGGRRPAQARHPGG